MACCGSSSRIGIGTRVPRRIVYVLVPRGDIGAMPPADAPNYATEAEAVVAAEPGYIARAVVIE